MTDIDNQPSVPQPGRVSGRRRLLDRFGRLVDWFIPAEIAANRDMRRQARLFLVSHLLGPFIGNSVPAAIFILDPFLRRETGILAASITGFWVFPLLLKFFKQYNILAILSIQNLMFCIIWSCLILDGVTSPTLPWVLTIPLLSFFYLGTAPEIRLLVLLMFVTNFTAFAVLSGAGIFQPSHIPFATMQGLGFVSTVAASMYVAMMALFFAKALATQAELELEMRDHIATAFDLRQAVAMAERAGAAKSEFLARIGHELRTPLNTIVGYGELLIADARADDQRPDVELARIRQSGMQLLRLVNDVLDLSKLETGKMEIFSESFSPADLLRDVVAEMGPAAAANGNMIILEIGRTLEAVCTDMRKVRIVLIQLLSNAIKFTAGGTIRVDATMEADTATMTNVLVFSVSDTGVGIDESAMPTIFERFAVNDDVGTSRYGGSGLGLTLSRKLCRLLGGDITVETWPGVGSRFTVSIPSERSDFGLPGLSYAVPPAAPAPAVPMQPDHDAPGLLRNVA